MRRRARRSPVDAARALRRSVRRISASLHTFRPLLDADWSESLRPELAWLSGTLGMEHAYESRLERLLLALHRLSGAVLPAQAQRRHGRPWHGPGVGAAPPAPVPDPAGTRDRGNLTVGAAKAGALLDRQLTLARTRAHSTALQALGSSRFHAVADNIAVLASEVPLTQAAATAGLHPYAAAAQERLDGRRDRPPPRHRGPPLQRRGPHPRPLPGPLPPPPGRPLAPGPPPAAPAPLRPRGPRRRRTRRWTYGCSPPARPSTATGTPRRRRQPRPQAARTPRIAPATAYALGVLHADQRHEVEAARFAFQQCWQKQAVGTPDP